MLRKIFILIIIIAASLLCGCSKLDEEFQGDLSQGQVGSGTINTANLLQGVYNSLEATFTSHTVVFPLTEITTDAAILPTRGPDWDDNGMWRTLHQHRWLSNNERIKECFNRLNGASYAATDLLRYNPTQQEQAEARFIRAWVMYLILDLFDQVPYRDPGENLTQPARVRKGIDALNYIISEINAIEANLPVSPSYKANKNAVKFLLIKCYLNKAVYENRANPAFNTSDMNKVISLADEIINSNASLAANYFDNFAPDNTNIGKENIFTQLNSSSDDYATWLAWAIPFHYSQVPSGDGYNGWATLSDFYNKFEPTDKRRGIVYSSNGSPSNPANGINAGFLIGQQYDYSTGAPLVDRNGVSVSFTPEVRIIETGLNFEITGIRPIKYFPDWPNYFSPDNDFVYFRFSDVLLMKAEAILRSGTGTNAGTFGNTPNTIINALRTHPSRSASVLSTVNFDNLLDE